jgi:3-methyladenine DNA glycosylase AlkD
MNDAEAVAAEILAALRERSDPGRLQATRKYIPTAMEVLGVKTPELRVVVGHFTVVLRGAPADHVLALAQTLVDGGTLEGRQAAYELLERHRGAREALTREVLEALGRGMDNWASVDGFSVMLAGVAWREGRVGDDTIDSWLTSADRWWRRAAVVSTVPLNMPSRGGTGDTARTMAICRRVVDERDDMIVKALSWSLRTLVKQDEAAVRAFLAEQGERLAPRVRREVTAKLETGRKNP